MDKIAISYRSFTQACAYSGSWEPAIGRGPCQCFQLYSNSPKDSFCSVVSIYWLLLASQKAEEKWSAIAAM